MARETGALYTFGIKPSYPATGYGYLEVGEKFAEDDRIEHLHLMFFKEKPDQISLVKEFLTTTATVTVSQSVLTTARIRDAGWDLGNAGKTRKILDHTIWH